MYEYITMEKYFFRFFRFFRFFQTVLLVLEKNFRVEKIKNIFSNVFSILTI